MKKVIYIKNIDNLTEKSMFKKIKKIFKNLFCYITKIKIKGYNVYVLPINSHSKMKKKERIVKKLLQENDNIYLIPENLQEKDFLRLINKYQIKCCTGENVKKLLLIKVLEYINNIKKLNFNQNKLTILVNNTSNINMYFIEEIAKRTKELKIVSLNINKFRKLEEKLYNDNGIAIQFSNSYQKSLLKSSIIINLDFSETDINEYSIYSNAIIINTTVNNIKIKSKLFEGIVVNSYSINMKKEIKEELKSIDLYNNYNLLALYESIFKYEFKNIYECLEILDEDKIVIKNLVGNNGAINKKEIKTLDKL